MMSFRNLRTQDDVAEYVTNLNTRWPERCSIIRHIIKQVHTLPFAAPHVVELGPGPGMLAEALLQKMSWLTYTGIDSSEPLLTFARPRLEPFGKRASLIKANLNENRWPEKLSGDIHAIVSMQSLHDLGDESRVNRIYGLAKQLLVPGGLFLNADLVVPAGQDNPNNPGRRSVSRHLQLLQSHGYQRVACTLQVGEFGCFVAFSAQ